MTGMEARRKDHMGVPGCHKEGKGKEETAAAKLRARKR
jgi:hypothetical protein